MNYVASSGQLSTHTLGVISGKKLTDLELDKATSKRSEKLMATASALFVRLALQGRE